MRDRYYRLAAPSDLLPGAALIRIYRRDGQILAWLYGDEEEVEAEPDLILFRAALLRLRQDLVGIFVWLEDSGLWNADWGDLVDYRGGRKSEGPAPRETPALLIEPDVSNAWDYTLNLNSITSPSLTT
ncbi:hypothetical protein [Devosia sp. CAU 1758]